MTAAWKTKSSWYFVAATIARSRRTSQRAAAARIAAKMMALTSGHVSMLAHAGGCAAWYRDAGTSWQTGRADGQLLRLNDLALCTYFEARASLQQQRT